MVPRACIHIPGPRATVPVIMNVIRLQELLSERYNTQLQGLRNKLTSRSQRGSLCSYSNHLSSRPVGHTMQKSLKLKLQNALNYSSSASAACSAVFIGGRRRNRKKRKNRNGQGKRKTKREECQSLESLTATTTVESLLKDLLPYTVDKPVVSCLDIEEPTFRYMPSKTTNKINDGDNDSMYYSNESLDSSKSGSSQRIDEQDTITDISDSTTTGYSRTHSEDSGVYDDDSLVLDDDSIVDAGYDDTYDEELDEHDLNNSKDNLFEEKAIDEDDEIEDITTEQEGTSTTESDSKEDEENIPPIQNEFEDIDLENIDEFEDEPTQVLTAVPGDDDEDIVPDIKIVREISDLSEADPFFKFVAEAEDDVIFDLSQLEVNNTDEEISKIKENNNAKQLFEVLNYPTVLEDEVPHRVPMELLIDNDDNDEVLFDAGDKVARKELAITCNPLYEHALIDVDLDKVSIKSYQSGFTTNFDNIEVTHISVPVSDKASHKSLQESSPLIKPRPPGGDRDDELACCIIL